MLRPLESGTTASMRGVASPNATTVWASGTGGTVLRSIDSGAHFTVMKVPNADSLDFRDIAAVDANNAYVLSAGEDGRIYRTRDGGTNWTLVFRNTVKGAFFDCIDFWDSKHGIAMSDPVDGKYLVYRTDDGEHWKRIEGPAVSANEASFAASGTCAIARGQKTAYIASGGGAQTHVFMSKDRGTTWTSTATPVAAGESAAGIFSLAFRDDLVAVAIGGNYTKPAEAAVVAVTRDGGVTWSATGRTAYVSGAAFNGSELFAVGTSGTRVSSDLGMTWVSLDSVEYNAVQFSGGVGYAVGPRGRVAMVSRP